MTGTAKIVGVAAVVGIMPTTIAIMAVGQPQTRPVAEPATLPVRAIDSARLADCQTRTVVDPDCVAVWDAERRRFFRDAAR